MLLMNANRSPIIRVKNPVAYITRTVVSVELPISNQEISTNKVPNMRRIPPMSIVMEIAI